MIDDDVMTTQVAADPPVQLEGNRAWMAIAGAAAAGFAVAMLTSRRRTADRVATDESPSPTASADSAASPSGTMVCSFEDGATVCR